MRYQLKGKTRGDEIKEHLARTFAKWQLPDEILFVDAFDKTSVGKSDKKVLRKKYSDIYSTV